MMKPIYNRPGWHNNNIMPGKGVRARWTMRKNGKGGFTLIELLVTIGILGLLFGIAIPAFNLIMPNIHIRSAARVIGSACQQARLKAATNTTEYRVCINTSVRPFSVQLEKGNAPTGSTSWTPESNNYWEIDKSVDFDASDPVTPDDTNTAVNFNVTRPDGTTPVVAGFMVIFEPNGATTVGNTFSVQLTNAKDRRYQVEVSNTTGRVKVNNTY